MEPMVKFEDFIFKKSKISDGVVDVTYMINLKTETGDMRHPKIEDQVIDPHPDLVNSIKDLKNTLLNIWNYEDSNGEVQATGLDVSYKGDNTGIMITGKRALDGGATGMNSHKIWLNSDEDEHVKTIKKQFDNHKMEVYQALYKGKNAQIKIDFKAKAGK